MGAKENSAINNNLNDLNYINIDNIKTPIKFQYISDIHLEFDKNSLYLKKNPLKIAGDILIICGDAITLKDNYKEHEFWDFCSKNYKQTIIIPGNHEFYKGPDLYDFKNGKIIELRENVKYYHNYIIRIDNIEIICSTLWGNIPEKNKEYCKNLFNDFRHIMYNKHIFTIDDFNEENKNCFNFIQNAVYNSKASHIIIATHHIPSHQLNIGNFPIESKGFTSVNLDKFIKKNKKIEYWIFGHSHINFDKKLYNTNCISNQLGYVYLNKNENDESEFILETKDTFNLEKFFSIE
jgi:predicted phosphodiesterase